MRLLTPVGAVAVLAALVGAGASDASQSLQRDCGVSQLVFSVGQEMSAATGHNPFSVHLTTAAERLASSTGIPAFRSAMGAAL